ncbi:type I polyketide synthase [Actinomadura monticuli]|uniref:Type I polyketide synthase n=1 Tax=Actinomadura monticuli TaxID=3097367 RepID=A0ABV4Q4J5_9ACTN
MANTQEAIAIIGVAARLPGALDARDYWLNLRAGRESVTTRTDAELLAHGVTQRELADPHYVRRAGLVPALKDFDAGFFGLTAREARTSDPQLKLFLEVSHAALEDGGFDPTAMTSDIAVFGAAGQSRYTDLYVNGDLRHHEAATLVLNNSDYVATFTSYRLDLRGPAMTVMTACSSSLVAVHLGCQSLLLGDCDMALAGGANVELPYGQGYRWGPGSVRSRDGHCRPFDAAANGTVFADGAGVVLLKRLSDAVADRDHIRAVIHGTALTNDGSEKMSFGAPSVEGQVRAIVQAMDIAQVSPQEISYVEAHGTGTVIGDPIEIAALDRAYRSLADGPLPPGSIPIGSVKGNIGHTTPTAGVASLVKLALAMDAGEIPPSIGFSKPNPRLELDRTPFFVASALHPWPREEGRPRWAGLSSLGVGGTNAHAVVGEAPVPVRSPVDGRPRIVVWSARTPQALADATARLADHCADADAATFADATATLQRGRTAHPLRAAVIASDFAEVAVALRSERTVTPPLTDTETETDHGVMFMFPDQDSQQARMGAGLYGVNPVFTTEMDRILGWLEDGPRLRELWLDGDATAFRSAVHAQPLLFAVEYALARVLERLGLRPVALAGHGLGELVAAAQAGVFDPRDAARLAEIRGRLTQEPGSAAASLAAAVAEMSPREPAIPVYSGLMGGRRLTASTATDPEFWARSVSTPARFEEALGALLADRTWTLLETGPGTALCGLAAAHPRLGDSRAFPVLPGPPVADDERGLLTAVGSAWVLGHAVEWAELRADEPLRRVPLPGYPYQRTRHWVTPETGPAAPQSAAPRENETAAPAPVVTGAERSAPDAPPASPFSVLTWTERPAPARHADEADLGWALALVPDDVGESMPLVLALQRRGYRVVLVRPGVRYAEAAHEFRLRPEVRDDFDAMLARLAETGRTPVLLTHGLAVDDWQPVTAATVDAQLDLAFRGLHTAVAAMAQRASGRRAPDILVVTRQAVDVSGGNPAHPVKAALPAQVRTLAAEMPGVTVRLVDMAGTDEADLAAELAVADPEPVVALRGGRRWVPRELDHVPVPAPSPLRQDGVYLLTGGLGGLGLAVARGLAATGLRPRLVLAGRSGLPPGPDDTARADALTEAVAQLEALGARVRVQSCDITDRRALARLLATAKAHFGPLNGVFHLAGLPGAGMLALRDRSEADEVLRPKIHGTLGLAEALTDPLDFFVSFSSRAALTGMVGSGDYAAANGFLDAHAAAVRGRLGRMLSVGWPAWHSVGMASSQLPPPGKPDATAAGEYATILSARTSWVLDEHRLDGTPVLPGAGIADLVVRAARERLDVHGALEFENLVFNRALATAQPREVRVRFISDGDRYRFEVVSRLESQQDAGWTVHAGGCVRALDDLGATSPIAVADLTSAMTERPAPGPGRQGPRMFTLGPRWQNVESVWSDQNGTKIVRLALPEAFLPDLRDHPLHPALLDSATASLREPERDGVRIPFRYRRLALHGPLPAELFSRIHRTSSDQHSITADIELIALDGTLLAEIEGFTMCSVDTAFADESSRTQAPTGTRGLGPERGARLLLDLLAARTPAHVLVRPFDGDAPLPLEGTGESGADIVSPIQVRATGRRFLRRDRPDDPPAPPPSAPDDIERRLRVLWSEALGSPDFTADADFFDVGGDSMSAMQVVDGIRDVYGLELGMATVFDHPTVTALSAVVREHLTS